MSKAAPAIRDTLSCMETPSLLRCPWCGEQPCIDTDWFDGAAIRCSTRSCRVRPSTGYCEGVSEATKIWNRRLQG